MNHEKPRHPRLSDNGRRMVCRISFLLFCFFPTAMICYWLLHPVTADDWSQRLQSQLAVETHIDFVENVGPYEKVFRGFEFRDPQFGKLLDAAEVRFRSGKTHKVYIEHPVEITSGGLVRLIERIEENLVRTERADRPWEINFGKTTILSKANDLDPRSFVAENMVAKIVPTGSGVQAEVYLRVNNPALDENEEWIGAYLHRKTDAVSLGTNLETAGIDTGKNFIPCWLLEDLIPQVSSFGSTCEFRGSIDVTPQESNALGFAESNGRLAAIVHQSTLRNIDLARLVWPLERSLTGFCTATIHHCRVENSKLTELGATVVSKNGTLNANFLNVAANHLGILANSAASGGVANEVVYQYLNFNLDLRDGQMRLSSTLTNDILAFDNQDNALLSLGDQDFHPLDGFVNGLVLNQPNEQQQQRHFDGAAAFLGHFAIPKPIVVSSNNDSTSIQR